MTMPPDGRVILPDGTTAKALDEARPALILHEYQDYSEAPGQLYASDVEGLKKAAAALVRQRQSLNQK